MTPTTQTRAHLTLLAAVIGLATVMIAGLGLAIYFALTPPPDTFIPGPDDSPAPQVSRRDQIASAPMLQVSPEAARGGTPALDPARPITIPNPTVTGAQGVPSGYPPTAQGAVGQLGDVLWSVLSVMDLDYARLVQADWFDDPASAEVWPVMLLIREFLHAGHLTDGLPPGATLTVEPVAAQIKGSDGPEWHVACVLLEITYTYRDQPRMAYGHCERMAWTGTRWVIGAGTHPVPAPSTWPGTDLAAEAGWRTWVEEQG